MKHSQARRVAVWISVWFGVGVAAGPGAQSVQEWGFAPSESVIRALDTITAQSLRGHLSFLASDILQGRPTPSTGQDVAAEYIAARFRAAGLDPIDSKDYFQTAPALVSSPDPETFSCVFSVQDRSISVCRDRFAMSVVAPIDINQAQVVRVALDPKALEGLPSLAGKVLVAVAGKDVTEGEYFSAWREFMGRARDLSPLLAVIVRRPGKESSDYFQSRFLRTPGAPAAQGQSRRLLTATVSEPAVEQALDVLPAGETAARLSLHLSERAPVERPLRNVAGILKGSDPALQDTYVLVSAHYDGTGPRPGGSADPIWNAANDDGSGTAAVIEIAAALGSLRERPRRSLVFLAYFGEEKGLLGSRYYASNPLVPIERTAAEVNLEQLGRTDSKEGDQTGKANLTGFDYSDVGEVFRLAGDRTGIRVDKHEKNSDIYFPASDNIVLAEKGVPAHTLSVTYIFPDYHGAGDHWGKIDFANMEKVTRMTALAVFYLAQSDRVPRWNESNPRAARFAKARERQAK